MRDPRLGCLVALFAIGCGSPPPAKAAPAPLAAIDGIWTSTGDFPQAPLKGYREILHIKPDGSYLLGSSLGGYQLGKVDRVGDLIKLVAESGQAREGAYIFGFGTAVLLFGSPNEVGSNFHRLAEPRIIEKRVGPEEQPLVGEYAVDDGEYAVSAGMAQFTTLSLRQDNSFTLRSNILLHGTWKGKGTHLALQATNGAAKFELAVDGERLIQKVKLPAAWNMPFNFRRSK